MTRKTSYSPCGPLVAALIAGAALSAPAATTINFQIDMNVAATNGTFTPVTQGVATRGSFNGWTAPIMLTNNPLGANPLLYTGSTNIPDSGVVVAYKYTIEPGAVYETTATHNRLIDLPNAGGTVTTPAVYYSDVAPDGTLPTSVTFRVDMAQQINTGSFNPITSQVYARGTYNGFGADVAMTNDPSIHTTNQFGLVSSNVYVSTYSIQGSPGKTLDYKYYIDTGANWESIPGGLGTDSSDNNNRFFNLAQSSPQTLPVVYFNNAAYAPVATNNTTFQVDMTAQVQNGAFDPTTGTVELRGNFNGWGTPQILLTNNPAGPNTNVYSTVYPISDGVGATENYKFWASVSANGGWETLANNRTMKVINSTTQVLPKVFFNDQNPVDFLSADTVVTFTVNMTNAVGTDAHAFDSVNDHVYINGIPIFVGWDSLSLAGFELTNNPVGSKLYSLPILIPKGTPLQQTYKFSINGADNEAAAGQNHVRFIRATGTYSMPLDTFGVPVTESSFGNLKVGAPSGGHVLISWLGRPGVSLQSNSTLTGGTWQNNPATDGLSSTNWPVSGAAQFFRLVKPN